MNTFMIPGNPPAVYFYELWAQEMLEKIPGSKIKVSSYPLLSPKINSEAALKFVVDHHLEELHQFQNEIKAPFTIIGHSLGGNIALRMLEAGLDDDVQKIILLHPFLRKPSQKGEVILKAASLFHGKKILQNAFIKNRRFLESLAPDLSFVTNEEIEKSFHLAYHESKIIAPDTNPIHIHPDHHPKVSVFYGAGDTWCPARVIADLKRQVQVTECSEPHDFVTSPSHRASLFAKIRS